MDNLQGRTDSEGDLTITDVSEGTHWFKATAENYRPAEAPYDVTSDVTLRFMLHHV